MKVSVREALSTSPVPCGLSLFKGLRNAALTRQFVSLALDNPFAGHLYDWLKETSFPEDHFIATLGSLSFEKMDDGSSWRIVQRFDSGLAQQTDANLRNAGW